MNFSGYAESLPGTVLDQLYQSLYVCQAILHSLPLLAKQYVVRMLHADPIPAGKSPVVQQPYVYMNCHNPASQAMFG